MNKIGLTVLANGGVTLSRTKSGKFASHIDGDIIAVAATIKGVVAATFKASGLKGEIYFANKTGCGKRQLKGCHPKAIFC